MNKLIKRLCRSYPKYRWLFIGIGYLELFFMVAAWFLCFPLPLIYLCVDRHPLTYAFPDSSLPKALYLIFYLVFTAFGLWFFSLFAKDLIQLGKSRKDQL